MARLILDSGAVIALAAGDASPRLFVERALERGDLVVIPAVAVAETTRGGGRDAPVNRVIKAVDEVTSVDEHVARQAGRLMAAAPGCSNATVDALIVAEAMVRRPSLILTGDQRDLSALTPADSGVRVHRLDSGRAPSS